MKILQKESDLKQRDAARILATIVDMSDPEQVMYTVRQGYVEAACGLLTSNNVESVETALAGLANTLKVSLRDFIQRLYSLY